MTAIAGSRWGRAPRDRHRRSDGRRDGIYDSDHNMFLGSGAGAAIQATGQYNIALGENALNDVATGDKNVAIGYGALAATSRRWERRGRSERPDFERQRAGADNTAIGSDVLEGNTTGIEQHGRGQQRARTANTEGTDNTALGVGAGRNITTGTRTSSSAMSIDAPERHGQRPDLDRQPDLRHRTPPARAPRFPAARWGSAPTAPFGTFTLHVRGRPMAASALENSDVGHDLHRFCLLSERDAHRRRPAPGYFLFGSNNGGTARHGGDDFGL